MKFFATVICLLVIFSLAVDARKKHKSKSHIKTKPKPKPTSATTPPFVPCNSGSSLVANVPGVADFCFMPFQATNAASTSNPLSNNQTSFSEAKQVCWAFGASLCTVEQYEATDLKLPTAFDTLVDGFSAGNQYLDFWALPTATFPVVPGTGSCSISTLAALAPAWRRDTASYGFPEYYCSDASDVTWACCGPVNVEESSSGSW